MDVASLYNVSSNVIREAVEAQKSSPAAGKALQDGNAFSTILNSAIENINTTNSYLSDMENEELKFALGETENTHDLMIAVQKASTALQYTVAIRDKFLESYKEIMNMQI